MGANEIELFLWLFQLWIKELEYNRSNKMSCTHSEDSDQSGHQPECFFMQRLGSDWVDAHADLSLCWARVPFCWFCHASAPKDLICNKFFVYFQMPRGLTSVSQEALCR